MMDQLSVIATGRSESLLKNDLKKFSPKINTIVKGKRVLVIGGAGSIGSSTIKALLPFLPSCVHVIDTNENQLAELVRDLRSSPGGLNISDFRTLPIDFGSAIMERFLTEQAPYDVVLNFAALKHVRSEKDIYSLLQMYDTNVIKPLDLLSFLNRKGGTSIYFCVSTDKAAFPVNLMGASKRLMEHVIFNTNSSSLDIRICSARFANVAFSEGSLLQSFQRRLEKSQPLASPVETRRFFISLQEAGELCLIAATCAPHLSLTIPRLTAEKDLVLVEEIARGFLKYQGLTAKIYHDESEARENLAIDKKENKYPLLLTPLDTQGEKSYEEFIGANERATEIEAEELEIILYENQHCPKNLESTLATIRKYIAEPKSVIDESKFIQIVHAAIPELEHKETKQKLDHRM